MGGRRLAPACLLPHVPMPPAAPLHNHFWLIIPQHERPRLAQLAVPPLPLLGRAHAAPRDPAPARRRRPPPQAAPGVAVQERRRAALACRRVACGGSMAPGVQWPMRCTPAACCLASRAPLDNDTTRCPAGQRQRVPRTLRRVVAFVQRRHAVRLLAVLGLQRRVRMWRMVCMGHASVRGGCVVRARGGHVLVLIAPARPTCSLLCHPPVVLTRGLLGQAALPAAAAVGLLGGRAGTRGVVGVCWGRQACGCRGSRCGGGAHGHAGCAHGWRQYNAACDLWAAAVKLQAAHPCRPAEG